MRGLLTAKIHADLFGNKGEITESLKNVKPKIVLSDTYCADIHFISKEKPVEIARKLRQEQPESVRVYVNPNHYPISPLILDAINCGDIQGVTSFTDSDDLQQVIQSLRTRGTIRKGLEVVVIGAGKFGKGLITQSAYASEYVPNLFSRLSLFSRRGPGACEFVRQIGTSRDRVNILESESCLAKAVSTADVVIHATGFPDYNYGKIKTREEGVLKLSMKNQPHVEKDLGILENAPGLVIMMSGPPEIWLRRLDREYKKIGTSFNQDPLRAETLIFERIIKAIQEKNLSNRLITHLLETYFERCSPEKRKLTEWPYHLKRFSRNSIQTSQLEWAGMHGGGNLDLEHYSVLGVPLLEIFPELKQSDRREEFMKTFRRFGIEYMQKKQNSPSIEEIPEGLLDSLRNLASYQPRVGNFHTRFRIGEENYYFGAEVEATYNEKGITLSKKNSPFLRDTRTCEIIKQEARLIKEIESELEDNIVA